MGIQYATTNKKQYQASRQIQNKNIFEYRKNIIYGRRNSAADNHGKILKFEL